MQTLCDCIGKFYLIYNKAKPRFIFYLRDRRNLACAFYFIANHIPMTAPAMAVIAMMTFFRVRSLVLKYNVVAVAAMAVNPPAKNPAGPISANPIRAARIVEMIRMAAHAQVTPAQAVTLVPS